MNPLTVVLILFAGMVGTALLGAVGWFCWRLLGAMGRLETAVVGAVVNQRDFTAELRGFALQVSDAKAGIAGLDIELQKSVKVGAEWASNIDNGVRVLAGSINDVRESLVAHRDSLREVCSERDTFRAILAGLKELDNGIKTFLTVVIQQQVPGAMPSDLVAGTPLDTTGKVYAYDEAEMAQHEAIRRKARGEVEPVLQPEERPAEVEII